MKPWITTTVVLGVLVLVFAITSASRRSKTAESDRPLRGNRSTNVVEIRPTLSDITNSAVRFFDVSNRPVVGYVEKDPDAIVLYSEPHGATALGEIISPITKEKLDVYVRMLRKQAEAEAVREAAQEAEARERALVAAREAEKLEEERKRQAASNAVVQARITEDHKRIRESNEIARASAELAAYRDRYIHTNVTFDKAVLIVDEGGKQNRLLSSHIAKALTHEGKPASEGFFKPLFVTDGLFGEVWDGRADVGSRLRVSPAVRSVLLG